MDEDIITMVNEETGEEIELRIIDNFDMEDRTFGVFLTLTEDEDEAEIVILEIIEEGEDTLLQSLDESEEDAVYDYYDSLCDAEENEEPEQ
ncbi:MAG: DUF1292 domain-containing protein [Clostridiales bacterium]|jgi:hypothetical protein|nr:DUF1292 domain-containing protein [Clostridiales bacterium]MCR5200674.1 DUF1292 domain-containing protein [Saccharofermentans sp.]